jgi:hypothetical protein
MTHQFLKLLGRSRGERTVNGIALLATAFMVASLFVPTPKRYCDYREQRAREMKRHETIDRFLIRNSLIR